MKTIIHSLYIVFCCIIMSLAFAACGDDSKDDDVLAPPSTSYSLENLIGVWSGETSNYTFKLAFGIYGNNTYQYSLFKYNSSSEKYESNLQQSGTYQFNANTGELILTHADYSTETLQVRNQTYSSFTLIAGQTNFYMKRYTGSGGDDGGSTDTTGWAPGNVSGKHFTLSYSSGTYNIYFTSNSTINNASNAGNFVLNGASYEKTSANEATISVTTSYTHTAYLTFTSSTGGTFQWSTGATGTFTVYDEQPSSNFSAPYSIAYMTFKDNARNKTMTFGSQSGSSVNVSYQNWSSENNETYNATYNRISDKQATLVIVREWTLSTGSSSITDTWTYNLIFTTATGGNLSYQMSSTNRFSSGQSGTGTFTLQ